MSYFVQFCPTCPPIPKQPKCKTINQYKISEHPDSSNYVHKDDINKYIKDNQLCKSMIQEEVSMKKEKAKEKINKKKQQIQEEGKSMSKLDKLFAETSDLKNSSSNLEGAYAGDNLFAVY